VAEEAAPSGRGNFTSSIGLEVTRDGTVVDAIPGMPAFESGLSPYLKINGVNGREFSVEGLRRAIQDAKTTTGAIEVEVVNAGKLVAYNVNYHGGNRFPHLERVRDAPDYLDEILKPLTLTSNHGS
jgi:predicted metalloprotease with PDZ domain